MPHMTSGNPRNPTSYPEYSNSTPSTAEIARNLDQAVGYVELLTSTDTFEQALFKNHIHPTEQFGSSQYLGFLSAVGAAQSSKNLAAGGKPVYWRAVEVLATTPLAINENIGFEKRRSSGTWIPNRASAERTSKFNHLIQSFAEDFPAVSAYDLSTAMLNVTNMMTRNKMVHHEAQGAVNRIITGAQHEIGVKKLARAAGRHVIDATIEQDLSGTDLFISGRMSHDMLNVDAKASPRVDPSTRHRGLPYIIDKGRIAIFSTLISEDFGGLVVVPDSVAKQKAPNFDTILTEAERESRYAHHSRNARVRAAL
jgi:hypothetical protein